MAGLTHLLKSYYDSVPDWVWPHLVGDQANAPEDKEFVGDQANLDLLADMESVAGLRAVQLDDRLRSVETRLSAVLAFTSILAAAISAALVAVAALYDSKSLAVIPGIPIVLILFYAVFQLLRAIWAALNGIVRTKYRQIAVSEIPTQVSEPRERYRSRILNLRLNHIQWNEWVVDQKVSQMAVAHAALRNVLVATGVMIGIIAVSAVARLG